MQNTCLLLKLFVYPNNIFKNSMAICSIQWTIYLFYVWSYYCHIERIIGFNDFTCWNTIIKSVFWFM